MKSFTTVFSALVLATTMAFAQTGQEKTDVKVGAAEQNDAALIANQLPSYPLTTCPVSQEPLDGMDGAVNMVVEGRLVRVCCKSCTKKVIADPKAFIATVDAAVIKQQSPGYPLMECPISGGKLGSMGEPVKLVHGTRLVQLCCKSCVKGFQKDPAATMAKLDAALIEQQLKTYPIKTCLVSGEDLTEEDTINYLYGTQLMRLCCKGCVKQVNKTPAKFVAMLHSSDKK